MTGTEREAVWIEPLGGSYSCQPILWRVAHRLDSGCSQSGPHVDHSVDLVRTTLSPRHTMRTYGKRRAWGVRWWFPFSH